MRIRAKPISNSRIGENKPRPGRLFFDLFPELADEDTEVLCLINIGLSPATRRTSIDQDTETLLEQTPSILMAHCSASGGQQQLLHTPFQQHALTPGHIDNQRVSFSIVKNS